VWPHDNAICAAGLMRYGFAEEAHRVMRGMVDASRWFGDLLPELFGGMPRAGLTFPVSYPTSCSPQAWAAASPLLFLRTILRFEPDFRNNVLHLAPAVPDWIGTLRLERIPIAGGHLGVEVTGEVVHALAVPEDLAIVSEARLPTRL
jgi:glycogen debranching enzyme